MPRTPNYNHERKERERLKAARKAEKQAVKAEKRDRPPVEGSVPDAEDRSESTPAG